MGAPVHVALHMDLNLLYLLTYLVCSPPWSRWGLSGERPLRDVTLSSVLDPSALSSGRVVHLGRSLGSIFCFEALTVVHSFHICRDPGSSPLSHVY
jgi:hypothetical protein